MSGQCLLLSAFVFFLRPDVLRFRPLAALGRRSTLPCSRCSPRSSLPFARRPSQRSFGESSLLRASFPPHIFSTLPLTLYFERFRYFFSIRNLCRNLRAKFGLLKSESPRRSLSKKEYVEWKIGSLLALTGRGAALFYGASDRQQRPWLSPAKHDIPGVYDLLRIHLFIIVMDYLFYCMHRTMHSNRWLYKVRFP